MAEILNKLVYAEPGNQEAKDLLADTYEQMGYQFGSTALRNSFLSASKELRDGVIAVKAAKAAAAPTLSAAPAPKHSSITTVSRWTAARPSA